MRRTHLNLFILFINVNILMAQYEIKEGNKKQGGAMWQEAKDIFTNLNLPLMLTRMEADAQK